MTVTASTSTATDELLSHDRWSREQLLEYQGDRLREVIEHAVSASPYYREALGGDALAEDVRLEDLPTLSKQTLMEQFDRVVADPRLRLAALEAHATGPDPGSRFEGAFHVFSTSGTTGRRGVFPQSAAEFGRWVAAAWRVRHRFGLGQGTRFVGIGAPTPLHITQKLFAAFGGFGERPADARGHNAAAGVGGDAERRSARVDRHRAEHRGPARRGAARRQALDRAARDHARGRGADGRPRPSRGRGVGDRAGPGLRLHGGADHRFRVARSRRPRGQRRPRRDRGGGRGGPPGAGGRPGLPGPDHEPDRPRAAPDPLRAVRHRHARHRPGARRQALSPDRAGRRAQRRHAALAEDRRRRDGRPPVPVASAVPGSARRGPVPARARADEAGGPHRPAAGSIVRDGPPRPPGDTGGARSRGRGSAGDRGRAGRTRSSWSRGAPS